jgi:hypothetical protein
MKKILLIAAVAAAFYIGHEETNGFRQLTGSPSTETGSGYSSSSNAIQAAFDEQKSGVQVQGEGVVSRLLADDNDGSRHQRFILTLSSGQTILIAHNIDLAPRIATLKSGDSVAFNGVYEWNAKGGVVHWTHHDPGGRHEAGWLKHAGQTYQ